MRLINLTRFLTQHATVSICAIAMIVLAGGCSSSGGSGKAQAVTTESNAGVTADPQVREALASACFDCHSKEKLAA